MGLFGTKDPNKQVDDALEVLRQQHRENIEKHIGSLNMPKLQRARQKLVRAGPAVVPALLAFLSTPRVNCITTDESDTTTEDEVEYDVARTVAEVLGQIGDPRAVDVLMQQARDHYVDAESALAKFPEGVDALLRELDDDDSDMRAKCVSGLADAESDRPRVAHAMIRVLDDPFFDTRGDAAFAARNLGVADPGLIDALKRHAVEDENDMVRKKADLALRELTG
jgi:HEAT repeat protein